MASANSVSSLCQCLQLLVSEQKSDTKTATNEEDSIVEDLENNMALVVELVDSNPKLRAILEPYLEYLFSNTELHMVWKFVEWCLILLNLLNDALVEEEQQSSSTENVPKGLLSISQQKTVKDCLQFIVALGIMPNLLQGIGIPFEQRTEHAELLDRLEHHCCPQLEHRRLVMCIGSLLRCLNQDTLQSIILSYHARDMLGSLFQLCHAPIKRLAKTEDQNEEIEEPTEHNHDIISMVARINDPTFVCDEKLIKEMWKDRTFFIPQLQRLLKQICPSLLMWELLLFQGMPLKNPKQVKQEKRKIPIWLQRLCNRLLTDRILQKNGIATFVQSVLDKASDVDLETGSVDKIKIEAVALLITGNPVKHLTLEMYMKLLSKQVFDLLHLKGTNLNMLLNCVASCIILQFCDMNIKFAEQYFLNELFKPLIVFVNATSDPADEDKCMLREDKLNLCIEDMYQVFVVNFSLNQRLIRLIVPFHNCLCSIFFFLQNKKSLLRCQVKEIIIAILTRVSSYDAVNLLSDITFIGGNYPIIKICDQDGKYISDDGSDENGEVFFEDLRYEAIIEILDELPNRRVRVPYFLSLLEKLTEFIGNNICMEGDFVSLKNSILILSLLQKFAETITEDLILDIAPAVDFVKIILESKSLYVAEMKNQLYGNETVMMALLILCSLTEYKEQLSAAHWNAMKKCLPGLKKVQNFAAEIMLQKIAEDLYLRIATHGAVNVPTSEMGVSSEPCTVPKEKVPSKSPERKSFCVTKRMKEARKGTHSKPSSRYEKAMQDLKESCVPTKGSALIRLGELIKTRDKEAILHKRELLNAFQENFVHEDSYVYLTAINSFGHLAELDIDLVLPAILTEYQKTGEHQFHVILKLGEVLLKICRVLGDMIAKYKAKLLHIYLIGAKHECPEIRCSSLSNMGEACKLLGFRLEGHWLQEILACVKALLQTDPDLHVKRSAMMVITLLLRGMGKDVVKVLSQEINNLYSLIKTVYNVEKNDDVLVLHSQLALEEINTIVKDMLTVDMPISKEIRILQ